MSDNITQEFRGHFKFLNGDQYYGEYAVDPVAKRVFRHGCGTYVTSRCHIYKGKWEFDKLQENACVKYPSKHTYCGKVNSEGSYEKGEYDFNDGCKLFAEFGEVEHLEFYDPNDTCWKGELVGKQIALTNEGIK